MGVRGLGAIAVNCMFYPEIGTKDRLDGNASSPSGKAFPT